MLSGSNDRSLKYQRRDLDSPAPRLLIFGKFEHELRRGLQDVAQSCLYSSKTGSQLDSETEHELLRYELGKALARSPEFRKQYIAQELARQRRLEN